MNTVLGTGFTVSLHWASSPCLSQHHTNSLLASDIWRECTKCFWSPRHLLSTQRASVTSVTVVRCPPLSFQGQFFGALQPILPFAAPILLDGEDSLSPASKQYLLQDHFGYRKRKEALCYPAYKDTCTGVYWGTACISSHIKQIFLGMTYNQTSWITLDQPPNNTLGSKPFVD